MAYIDRDKTLIALHSMHTLRLIGERDETDKLFDMMLEIIQKQPTADVEEVKHGEWVKYKPAHYECSMCGKKVGGNVSNYCPDCGAKMDGKKQKNDFKES